MKKTIRIVLLLLIGFVSCKNSDERINKLEIAKQYYNILDHSSHTGLRTLLTDSIVTIENDYDYTKTFSQSEYVEWLKWDSVFNPTYEILQIEQQDEMIKAKILKTDRRIFFLHEEPFITNQIIRFQKDKIITVETDYVNFNEKIWEKNKTGLLSWIDKNHPELNGFIYDQTEAGGAKFLKAIKLYKNRKIENNTL